MNSVALHPGKYTPHKQSFMEKYLPQLVQIYQNGGAKSGAKGGAKSSNPKKVVVFDLDETIGAFGDLFILWRNLHSTQGFGGPGADSEEAVFHQLLALFPEMFRPGLFPIMEFIYRKFQGGACYPVYVYTNNQCDAPRWVDMIISFIDRRLGITAGADASSGADASADADACARSLFARPICAFKIGGKRVEPGRTTSDKTPAEFIRCSLLPRNVEICFVDDQKHPAMCSAKVYFIQPPPYFHPLSRDEIIERFYHSPLQQVFFPETALSNGFSPNGFLPNGFLPNGFLPTIWESHPPSDVDVQIGKKIMYYVREFFLVSLRKETTRRNMKRPATPPPHFNRDHTRRKYVR